MPSSESLLSYGDRLAHKISSLENQLSDKKNGHGSTSPDKKTSDTATQKKASSNSLFSNVDKDLPSKSELLLKNEKDIHRIEQTLSEIASEHQKKFEYVRTKVPDLEHALDDITKVIEKNRRKNSSQTVQKEQIVKEEKQKKRTKLPKIKLTHRSFQQLRLNNEIVEYLRVIKVENCKIGIRVYS